jgi:hypothetical protein
VTFLLVLGLGAALSGCGWVGAHSKSSKPNGFELHGYVAVPSSCLSGVPDIHAGAEVKIADEAGKTIATGSLGSGVADGSKCNYPFEISNVPGSYDTVMVLVGLQPAAKFATSELREGGAAVIAVATPPTASSSPS